MIWKIFFPFDQKIIIIIIRYCCIIKNDQLWERKKFHNAKLTEAVEFWSRHSHRLPIYIYSHFFKPAVHHHGYALLPTLGAIEGDLAALHHPRYEGTPLLVCAVVSFPWKIMETSWWAGELLVVVKCQNIINHPDQYMAQHGCIVKQSLLCHSLLGDHYVSLQWQTVKQSITAIKTSHARLLHSLMHNTTMETNMFWNQKWKWSSRPFKLQSKWYTHTDMTDAGNDNTWLQAKTGLG